VEEEADAAAEAQAEEDARTVQVIAVLAVKGRVGCSTQQ